MTRFTAYRPSDRLGFSYLALACTGTLIGILLSLSNHWCVWFAGQGVLALVFLQWFSLLHEAGHRTLFRTWWLNQVSGHVAGFLAVIPFDCWKSIHALHHRWTGWQDLDVTTSSLQPRKLHRYERWVLNICWRLWLPFFATVYRLSNYWHLLRLLRLFRRAAKRRRIVANIVVYLCLYAVGAAWLGWQLCLQLFGLSLYTTLVMQDLLILSQHTHIPMRLSQGTEVEPFSATQQQIFTRSLVFPKWFSQLVLVGIDAHEVHHVFPHIPGYYLGSIQFPTMNALPWWEWIWKAKRIPADVLLFNNRDQTRFAI